MEYAFSCTYGYPSCQRVTTELETERYNEMPLFQTNIVHCPAIFFLLDSGNRIREDMANYNFVFTFGSRESYKSNKSLCTRGAMRSDDTCA